MPKVDKSLLSRQYREYLAEAYRILAEVNWNLETVNSALMTMIKEKGFKTGDFFMDLRLALTGKKLPSGQ